MTKPFKGSIYNWSRKYFNKEKYEKAYPDHEKGLGYCIFGYKTQHIKLGCWWRTSYVVKEYSNDEGLFVETKNSIYKLQPLLEDGS